MTRLVYLPLAVLSAAVAGAMLCAFPFPKRSALYLLPLAFVEPKCNPVLIVAWAVFATLTIVFGISKAPFLNAGYLGHQARELFTHTLVTIPLAAAAITCLTWRAHSCMPRSHSCERLPLFRTIHQQPFLIFLALATYLAAGVLLTGARHHAQSSHWTAVICAHFFEHTFSYLVVPAHAQLFYLLGARPA